MVSTTAGASVQHLHKVKAEEYWACPKRNTWNESAVNTHLRGVVSGRVRVPGKIMCMWNEVFIGMGANHPNVSTGMAAIICTLEIIKPDVLYLAGFDTVLNPKLDYKSTVPTQFNDGGSHDTGHDWRAENKLLQFLGEHFKTNILDICLL